MNVTDVIGDTDTPNGRYSNLLSISAVMSIGGLGSLGYLGVQQCFGVLYHELTTLRRVYFASAALAARAK